MQRWIVVWVLAAAAAPARAEPVYVEPSFSIGGLAGVDHALHAGRVAVGFFGAHVRGGGFVEANDLVDGGFGLGVEGEADVAIASATRLGLRLGAANGLWDRDHPTLVTVGPRVRYADLVSAGVDVMLATEVQGSGGPAVGWLATVRGEGKGGLVVAGAALLLGAIVGVGFAATDHS
jgi:hypothetical protein